MVDRWSFKDVMAYDCSRALWSVIDHYSRTLCRLLFKVVKVYGFPRTLWPMIIRGRWPMAVQGCYSRYSRMLWRMVIQGRYTLQVVGLRRYKMHTWLRLKSLVAQRTNTQ
jgi:hypothetical protein